MNCDVIEVTSSFLIKGKFLITAIPKLHSTDCFFVCVCVKFKMLQQTGNRATELLDVNCFSRVIFENIKLDATPKFHHQFGANGIHYHGKKTPIQTPGVRGAFQINEISIMLYVERNPNSAKKPTLIQYASRGLYPIYI